MHRAGDTVGGRYELVATIGEGGMGTVWRARHVLGRHEVALKVLHADVSRRMTSATRFLREASAAAEIGHEGIVKVLDAGVDAVSGTYFLAMELLEGESFRAWLARRAGTRADALDWIDALLEPLSAAHARGYVHRDLKPENVFLVRRSDGGTALKLLDLGLARQVDEMGETRSGAVLGTPRYMAPEQAVSARNAGPTADVWSVGVMLFEALSGTYPFDGETPAAVVVAMCTTDAPSVATRVEDVSVPLAQLIARCLARDPTARPRDASALRVALREALGAASMPAGPLPPSAVAADLRGRTDRDAAAIGAVPAALPRTREGGARALDASRARLAGRAIAMVAAMLAVGAAGLATWLAARNANDVAGADAAIASAPIDPVVLDVGTWHRVEHGAVTFALPPDWVRLAVPSAAQTGVAWRAPLRDASPMTVIPQARLVVEPFEGTLTEYVEIGLRGALLGGGRIVARADTRAGTTPSVVSEVVYERGAPPYRLATVSVVSARMGHVLHCISAIAEPNEAQVCRYVVRTVVVR